MKKLRWQILVVVVTLIVVGALLLSQQPALQTFLPQPTEGGVYTEALVGSMSRLNPMLDLNNSPDRDVNSLIFSGLIRFDGQGLPQPDLAESWGISLDGVIYNVSLQPDAVWHDGQPVTSDDVIFTIEVLKSAYSFFPEDIKQMWSTVEIRRLDAHMIQFVLPEPFAPFLDYLTFGVLPKHLLEGTIDDQFVNLDFNINPVGSGPYRFDHLLIQDGMIEGVVLTAFDEYHGKKPYVSQVVFRYYDTPRAAMDAYLQGEVLGVSAITGDILQDALNAPNLSVYTSRLPDLSLIYFNLKNPEVAFFQDVELRQALLQGLNRQWMIDRYMNGQAIIADGPLFPGTWAYFEGTPHIKYEPDAAIERLKKNGYELPLEGEEIRVKNGQQITFTLLHPDTELHTTLANAIKEDWALLGVQVELRALSYDRLFFDHLVARNYEAALVDLSMARSPDPDPYPFWHQAEATGGQNYGQWDSRTASEFLEQARVNTDPEKRTRLYRNFQVVFAEQLPALPLFYPVYSYGVDVQVGGVQIAPLFDVSDRFTTISDWFLVTRRSLDETQTPEAQP